MLRKSMTDHDIVNELLDRVNRAYAGDQEGLELTAEIMQQLRRLMEVSTDSIKCYCGDDG